MNTQIAAEIKSAKGKVGVLCIGLGAVATTLIGGIEAIKQGIGKPIGSLTQLGHIRLGKRTEDRFPLIKDFVPLAELDDLVFGAWDIYKDNGYEAAVKARVLDKEMLNSVSEQLANVKPMTAVFEQDFVRQLTDGDNFKTGLNNMDLAEQLKEDIHKFKVENNCDRMIVMCVSSTEKYLEPSLIHEWPETFVQGLYNNSPDISPSMIYAYAAIESGASVINCTPNLLNIPALVDLANRNGVCVSGKDLKTGQTLVKTVLASMFRSRCLKVNGWYSANILGNRDGQALKDPESFKSKEKTKGDVLSLILMTELFPELYHGEHPEHQVHIHPYGPKGDDKEGWDQIDFEGFLGSKMSLKINILCRDSLLAAPLCLDLILFTDLAQRAGKKGVQEFLSYYFKAPQTLPGVPAIHVLGEQEIKLANWLRALMGEDLITYLGLNYDD